MGEKGGSGLSFRSKTAIGLACALVAVVLALLALATCSHQPESSGGPVASPVKVVLSGDPLPDAAAPGKVVLYGGETPVDEREFENVGEIDFGKVGPNEVKAVVESVPVASDGSTYALPAESETLTITGSGEEVVLEIKLERMAAEDMTKEQLEAVAGELEEAGRADAAAAAREHAAGAPSVAGSADAVKKDPAPSAPSSGNAGNSGAASDPEPSKPAHTHDWIAQTEERWVVDQAAWDEIVPGKSYVKCSCGQSFADETEWGERVQSLGWGTTGHSYSVVQEPSKTIHHDEVGHYETVTVGYVCSGCGATK